MHKSKPGQRGFAPVDPLSRLLDKCTPEPTSGCWLWTAGVDNFGYGRFNFPKPTAAHRASWALLRGAIPAGLCVLHRCDNPPCINPDHLFLGTKADNTADAAAKGRLRGTARGTVPAHVQKLSPADIVAIRAEYPGVPRRKHGAMARRYGVTVGALRSAAMRKTWRMIP